MPLIDVNDPSYQLILRALSGFIRSSGETDVNWDTFFESSPGQTILRTSAGLGAFINYAFEFYRREGHIDTALMRSSIYLKAQELGYPVNRKTPAVIEITYTYNGPETVWNYFRPVGTMGGFNLVPLADLTNLQGTLGEQRTDRFALGDWIRSELIEIPPGGQRHWEVVHLAKGDYDISNLRDAAGNAFFYMIGDQAVGESDLTDEIEDISLIGGSEKVFVQTAHEGGVLLKFGDGNIGRAIVPGTVGVEYIRSQGRVDGAQSLEVSLVSDFTFVASRILSAGTNEDALKKLRTLIPTYFASLRRAVTGPDHESLLMNLSGDLVSAKARPTQRRSIANLEADPGNAGNGTLENLTALDNAPPETWTLTVTDDTVPGSEIWSVIGSVTGPLGNATTEVPYNNGYISFFIDRGVTDFQDGDIFTFDVTLIGGCCVVDLSYLFVDEHLATEGVGGELQAMLLHMDNYRMVAVQIILADPVPIGIDAKLTVVIEKSFISKGEIEEAVRSAIDDQAMTLGATFHVAELVQAVLSVPGVARAYLARPSIDRALDYDEYYRLDNLEIEFTTDLNLAGSFEPPVHLLIENFAADPGNVGDGSVGDGVNHNIRADDDTAAQTWTLTAVSPSSFSVTGSVDGAQANATVGTAYNGLVNFTIVEGAIAFAIADEFTFDTVIDAEPGYVFYTACQKSQIQGGYRGGTDPCA
jgi:hypothetical protein